MRILIAVVFFVQLFSACRQDAELVDEKLLLPADVTIHQDDTVMTDTINAALFSRLNKAASQGMLYEYRLPPERQDKHFYIVFKGKIRSNYAQSNAAVVFLAFDKNNNQLCWWALPARPHLVYQNQWNTFHDSLHIPGLINDVVYTTIRAFPFLGASTAESFDVDSLKVSLKQRQEY